MNNYTSNNSLELYDPNMIHRLFLKFLTLKIYFIVGTLNALIT